MTNAVADIEQETPEIGKERQLAGVGTGAGAGTNNNKKPHDHALASILGPAFVAAVAYVDPGNVAANITSGARYGYLLVWVLVLANAMSVLMLAGIRDILIISTPKDLPNFEKLLGDGSHYGVHFSYKVQPSPDGLAQAFLLGEEFIDGEPCALVLGDNIFYGNGLGTTLRKAVAKAEGGGGASVFGYYVDDPERYGVVEFDEHKKAVSIEEKPKKPKSHYAVTGLYFYDERVVEFAKRVRPSARGELEITDLNKMYLEDGSLNVRTLGRGYAWLDTGTMDSLYEAGEFVRTVQRAQGLPIAIVEEIAYENGWISKEELLESAERYGKSPYGKHLKDVAEGKVVIVPNH